MYHTEKHKFYSIRTTSFLLFILTLFFSFESNAQQYYEDSDSYYIAPKYGYGIGYESNTKYNIISPEGDNDISSQLNDLSGQLSAETQGDIQYRDNDEVYQEYRGSYAPHNNPETSIILDDNIEHQDNDSAYKEYHGAVGTYSDEDEYVDYQNDYYDYDGFNTWKGDGADNDGDWYPMHFYY